MAVHERVNCGPLARYFHQVIYTWQTTGVHPVSFWRFYGGKAMPKALSQEMYDDLYLKDRICVPANRLKIDGEFYAKDSINAIVMPIRDGSDYSKASVSVVYDAPKGLLDKLYYDWKQRDPPPVSDLSHPVVLNTTHGDYLLIGKKTAMDTLIRKVEITK